MSVFENVTVTREANVYFNGQVTSRTITFADGSSKTLGIMQPGEYTFNTSAAEIMEILSGSLEVLISGSDNWQTIAGGESFEVPANSSFQLKIKELSDYCCSFLK
ncbi:MAG: pyrimidine/purine nucleoside phosphorylase [Desulfobulbaceae bacterium]|nr:MAG: pyrimidine/purine nucleoside phosphorylase [Desulfobulbaceae bacterium]